MPLSLSDLPHWRQLRTNGTWIISLGIVVTTLQALFDGALRWGNVGLIGIASGLLAFILATVKWSRSRRPAPEVD